MRIHIPTIGVRLPVWAGSTSAVLGGMHGYLRETEAWSIVTDADTYGEMEPRDIGVGWEGDGLVLYRATEEELEDFKSRGIAVVLLSSEGPDLGFPRVIPDNVEAGNMAGRHLLGLSLENFAFLARGETLYQDLRDAPGNRVYPRERLAGFRDRLKSDGYEVKAHFLPGFPLWKRDAWKAVEGAVADFLRSLPAPAGLFAADDALAAVVLRAAERIGKDVPNELAVMGFGNDLHYCHASSPAITSIGYPGEAVGRKAAKTIESMLAGEDLTGSIVRLSPGAINARESTDVIAVPDPEIARMVRWIRRNSQRRAILVSELAEHSSMALTTLKERFKKHMGHGPKEEIIRARLHHLEHLLKYSDLPLKEISSTMQFASPHEMSRFYHRVTGKRPSDVCPR